MTSNTTKPDASQPAADAAVHLFDNWFDPIETGVRDRVREFIQAMIEGKLYAPGEGRLAEVSAGVKS